MVAKYTASGSQNLASSAITALGLSAATASLRRAFVSEFIIADVGTPADNVVLHTAQRITAVGTSTAVTPTKLDPADAASDTVAGENHTAEPTYTANEEVLEIPLNTRATFRWVAAPGFEIVIPATNVNGIGFKALHASATTEWRVTAAWRE